MAFTYNLSMSLTGNGSSLAFKLPPYVADADNNLDEIVNATQTGKRFRVSIADLAKVKCLGFSCSTDLTIFTNSADGTGGDVLTLKAGTGLLWTNDMHFTNPLTQAVTDIYVDNNTSVDCALKVRVCQDASV